MLLSLYFDFYVDWFLFPSVIPIVYLLKGKELSNVLSDSQINELYMDNQLGIKVMWVW